MKRLEHYWQTRNPIAWSLFPLSLLFCLISGLRRMAYRSGMLVSTRVAAPVIIVGNITVGGTGKTPLVVWLARHLRERGFRPGVLTRGYLGAAQHWPQSVGADSDPRLVGDEAVLLARRCGCPVVAGPNRVDDARMLLDQFDCNLLVSDDGMQHYALDRDLEVAVVDGERRLGNRFCLPAGPLRERPARLREVDMVVVNGRAKRGEFAMSLRADRSIALRDPLTMCRAEDFQQQRPLAVAGIGNPGRFYATLRQMGLTIRERTFPDHHGFSVEDFAEFGGSSVVMTEKDAVKCEAFADHRHWYLPVDARPDPAFVHQLDKFLTDIMTRLKDNG